jgi:hypothetical protein
MDNFAVETMSDAPSSPLSYISSEPRLPSSQFDSALFAASSSSSSLPELISPVLSDYPSVMALELSCMLLNNHAFDFKNSHIIFKDDNERPSRSTNHSEPPNSKAQTRQSSSRLAPPPKLGLQNAIKSKHYNFEIPPPIPYIVGYGPFSTYYNGYP